MVLPPADAVLAVVVERLRSVAGDVLRRNGHMALDLVRRASMAVATVTDESDGRLMEAETVGF